MDFQNKRVTVMGLGLYEKGTGIEAVKFFLRHGAKVTVTDLRSAKELEGSVKELVKYYGRMKQLKHVGATLAVARGGAQGPTLRFVLRVHKEEDFKNTDIVFQNPSVPADSPYLRIAEKRKIPIVNDWSIFLSRHTPKVFVGVTGTRGKSTTTAMIYEMLKKHHSAIPRNRRMAGQDSGGVRLAGNLGTSPLSFIDTYAGEPIVAELSSWLLHHFPAAKKSPNVAVVLNIMNDHMDKYRSMREYVADKENVFRFQTGRQGLRSSGGLASGYIVLNYDHSYTRGMAKRARGKVLWFSAEKGLPRWVPLETLQIPGEHNRANALAAAVAAEAAGVTRRDIEYVLKTFRGLPDRLEMVRVTGGVKYYNDTTATTPEATIAALKTLAIKSHNAPHPALREGRDQPPLTLRGGGDTRIVLIAGGADKKLEYRELTKYVKQYCKAVVLLPGTATGKIKKEVSGVRCPVSEVRTMKDAVKKASALAQDGDIVLLSPAAASFGIFKNEFDRGKQFLDAVKKL